MRSDIMKRMISFMLAIVLLFSCMPVNAFATETATTQEPETTSSVTTGFEGKTVSILGDSISTYTGVSNNTSFNSTIGSNTVYYTAGRYDVYRADTWWQQVIDALGMELLVNNSWSGSMVVYPRRGEGSEGYKTRCVNLHNNEGQEPDVILVFMGTNDFSYVNTDDFLGLYTLGTADAVDYETLIVDNGDGTFTYTTPTTTCEAYAIMLHKMKNRYPNAEIYCMNLIQRRDPDYADSYADAGQPTEFNGELAKIIAKYECTLVDLENCDIEADSAVFDLYIGDKRVHPNSLGMDLMSEAVISAMLGQDTDLYDVSFDLTNVTGDGAHAVLPGNDYTVTLTEAEGFKNMSVTVTMGGEDVSASCYADGVVSIPAVTGDVVISAEAMEREPLNFRWEFDGTELVTVTSDGNAENALTNLEGSVTDGVFSSTRYQMERTVMLLHDRPWILEWKGTGKGGVMLAADSVATTGEPFFFRRQASQMFAFGAHDGSQYNNYGITLPESIDTTLEHTYRLENRIADDGSNMVYLYVDDVEIGALNGYFIGGTAQNITSDWISGQDFLFNYIGTQSHPLTDMSVEYLQIEEDASVHDHSYTAEVTLPACMEQGYTDYICSLCGDSYRTPWLDETAYEGMTIACVGDSITAAYGVTKDETDYVTLLAEQLGMDYIRLGASGTTLCTDGSRTCNIDKLTEANLQGADVVTIAMGINDFCAAGEGYYELGDINSTDTSTIYGAVRMWCERIVELRKTDSLGDIQFYFVTPVITSWNNSVTSAKNWDQSKTNIHGYTLRDLCNAIIEVAALYDVAVIDLNLLSGMYYVDAQDNNTAEFGGDGVHPGEKGHEMMAAALANVLLQNNLRDDHAHTFGSWITTTWPSCVAGEAQRVCSVCSATESSTLEPNDNHRYNAVVTAPTYTQQGYTTYTCSLCGDSYVSDYTDAIQPGSYRWEMQDNAMVSVTTGGNTANALTLDSGSITDGTLASVRYTLQSEVRLYHNLPWVIEWRSSGNWDGMLFGSTMDSSVQGLTYLFRYAPMDFLALGEYTGTWDNYGIVHDIDMTVSHVFRLENRIAEDGSNAVYLLVDGQEIDVMHHYYVGGTNQNQTVNWANGRDIVFANIGTTSHPVKDMKLDYLQVWEAGEPAEPMSLRYDDHVDMTGKTVEILDAGMPTSYHVGYGVEENAVLDTAVVTLEGDTLVATGIGTAMVRIDGQPYKITVTAAPISLILLAGQSMMQGSEGNADQSIVCPEGMVYATYGDRYTMTVDNATNFAPSAMTGDGSALNVNGTTENLSGYPVYALTAAGSGKMGPDSGVAYQWVKGTGEKVWIVNAAHGGSSINTWQDGGANYEEAALLFSACQETLRQEIAAGHYTLSHMGCFWRQGAADEQQTAQWYIEKFLAMWSSMKSEFSVDMDGDGDMETLEFVDISMEMAGHVNKTGYRFQSGNYDSADSTYFMTYEELELRGHRVAQFWMASNPELPDINLVCTIGESWVTMPDGSDGVAEYFANHYENGTVDYTTQVAQEVSWYTPTTPADVKDSIHFNQIGYNEMGIDCARNALILLGYLEDTNEETTVTFVNWTGYEEVTSLEASTIGQSSTLVVPIVYPCYRSKEVTYQVSDGLRYEYYDLISDTYNTNGTLTAIGANGSSVTVVARQPRNYRWELQNGTLVSTGETENTMTRLSGSTEDGLFVETRYAMAQAFMLYHDKEWVLEWQMTGPWVDEESTAGKKLFSQDGAQATAGATAIGTKSNAQWLAFAYYNGTSHVHYGIDLANYGLSLSDEHVYRLYNKVAEDGTNMIYLAVDGVELGAMNIRLSTGEESNWVSGQDFSFGFLGTPKYFLDNGIIDYIQVWENGHSHSYENGICTGCGAEHPNLANYRGKVISVMGDSISTFAGYIPVADGFNREHLARYPQDNLLTDVNETWWMQVVAGLDAKLGINESWRGSTLSGAVPVTTGDTGENAAMSNLIRIQNMGSNGTPDVILLYGGTNDLAHVSKVGTFDPATAPRSVDLTTTKWDNLADGFVHTLLRMRYYYPDAVILAMLPTYTASYYTDEKLAEGNAVMAQICEHYGIPYVDLRDSGVTADHLPDGIHPGEEGMDLITAAVVEALLEKAELEPGEHVVYPVSHELTQVKASLGHWKGVDANSTFTEVLTGTEMTVTVTMDGVDITADCYKDGTIAIETVTGALVITATGSFTLDGHLQQLPDPYCGVNLWQALEHDDMYYASSGWTTHSSGQVKSVTFPVTPGDRLYASSFGAAGTNGGTINGIRVTYFAEDGTANSIDADTIYEEFSTYGYLTVPADAVAVSIPMWTDSEDWEIYLYCVLHSHLQQLPEGAYNDTNLWQLLTHDPDYYSASGWAVHSSGNVTSVTIPVSPGDRLYASSFGAAGTNGSSTNGIRVTYFAEHSVLTSVSAATVYQEFSENGYLTVPEGATAVSIPMWTDSEDWELYILTLPDRPVVTVEISWGAMEFTYTDGAWDPDSHIYGEGTWTPDNESNYITVANEGTLDASVTFVYENVEGYAFTGSFAQDGTTVTGAMDLPANGTCTVWLTLTGRPEDYLNAVTIGYVTVIIQ